MDGKGRYLDNIFVERLWRSIKYEEVYLKAYQTVAEARTGINAYLEFYNRQRPHQALGYRTPAEVYQHGQEERGAAAEEAGLPSGLVKPSAGVGDSLNLALVLSSNNGVNQRFLPTSKHPTRVLRLHYHCTGICSSQLRNVAKHLVNDGVSPSGSQSRGEQTTSLTSWVSWLSHRGHLNPPRRIANVFCKL